MNGLWRSQGDTKGITGSANHLDLLMLVLTWPPNIGSCADKMMIYMLKKADRPRRA